MTQFGMLHNFHGNKLFRFRVLPVSHFIMQYLSFM